MTFNGRLRDTWHTISPAGAYTAGSPAPQYRMDDSGAVHFRGLIVRNAAADGATLFTLPADYWPTGDVRRPLITLPDATSTGRIAISLFGVVSLHERAGTVTSYYLDCSFTAL